MATTTDSNQREVPAFSERDYSHWEERTGPTSYPNPTTKQEEKPIANNSVYVDLERPW